MTTLNPDINVTGIASAPQGLTMKLKILDIRVIQGV
jgi:hypothetical protein